MRPINGTALRSSRKQTSLWQDFTASRAVAVFDDYAEVKRMYTRPMARGRGVAKALLRGIEDEPRAEGMSVLRLEREPGSRRRSLSAHGVSTARSVRRVGGNACP